MKALTSLLLSISIPFALCGQVESPRFLFGNIFNEAGEDLIGATVQWQGTDVGTFTDESGNFRLPAKDTTANLLIQYVGIEPLTVEILPSEDTVYIQVTQVSSLSTVEVTEHRGDIYTSTLHTVNMESITSCELKKAACCNLAESFETSGSVDVMRQDAVTSATEVQLLGLRGIYSQLLLEKRPVYVGLGSPLALEYIPGTWVEGIQVSKGASTVQNGPQAMTGQINMELVKPDKDKPLFVNIFGATTGRAEANLHFNKQWNPAFSSGLLLHGSTTQGKFDRNGDSFLDQPLKQHATGLWRNVYRNDKLFSQFNVQVLSDRRSSGQRMPDTPESPYHIDQANDRADVYGKLGLLGFEKPMTSMALIYGASLHHSDNTFGRTRYKGRQRSFYANLLYASFFRTTDHRVNLGASFQFDDYDEKLNDQDFSHREQMPGVFGEYAYTGGRLGIIAGLRADHLAITGPRAGQAEQSKTFLTPRLNLKYNFTDDHILRLSLGRGVRSAQILPENLAVLASNRRVELRGDLRVEDAWNAGLNLTRNFRLGGRGANMVVDLYRTAFRNQIVMDMESAHGKVLFYNLDGRSFANSLLLLTGWSPSDGFDLKVAYKWNDVRVTYFGDLRQRPMTAAHRGLLTLNYETPAERWMFNTNVQFTGRQRFVQADHLPANLTERTAFEGYSPAYVVVNAQVTRRFRIWELYVGGENLGDFRQEQAIIDWRAPFGEYFDAMQVWGPLVGIRGYAGIRMWLD
ncbi:MAG: hypothetical protein RLY31_728 [Bacteroidota bacterium]